MRPVVACGGGQGDRGTEGTLRENVDNIMRKDSKNPRGAARTETKKKSRPSLNKAVNEKKKILSLHSSVSLSDIAQVVGVPVTKVIDVIDVDRR